MNNPYQQEQQQPQNHGQPSASKGNTNDATANATNTTHVDIETIQETNFDLQATIATLQAELQHSQHLYQQQQHNSESKWQAQLRLVQQEAQRWKQIATQNHGQQSRSIVHHSNNNNNNNVNRSDVNNENTVITNNDPFSHRLMGGNLKSNNVTMNATADVGVPAAPQDNIHTHNHDPVSSSPTKMESMPIDYSTFLGTSTEQTTKQPRVAKPTAYTTSIPSSSISSSGLYPINRLALNLLTQITPMDHNNDDSIDQTIKTIDSHIRQILIQIACQSTMTKIWTEGTLVEWLIQQTRSLSASATTTSSSTILDRYWSIALWLSPRARQHIVHNVMMMTTMMIPEQQQNDNNGTATTQRRFPSKRKSRIRPIPRQTNGEDANNNNKEFGQMEKQRQVLKSYIQDPYWDPNQSISLIQYNDDDNVNVNSFWSLQSSSSSPSSSSSKNYHNWIQSLANSQSATNLETLLNILGEVSTMKTNYIYNENNDNNDDDNYYNQPFDIWWTLCFPGIIKTIQWMILCKLIDDDNDNKYDIEETNGRTTDRRGSRYLHGNQKRNLQQKRNTSSEKDNFASRINQLRLHRKRYRIHQLEYRYDIFQQQAMKQYKKREMDDNTTNQKENHDDENMPETVGTENLNHNDSHHPNMNMRNNHHMNISENDNNNNNNDNKDISENGCDRVFALAVSVLRMLLIITPIETLEHWYGSKAGLPRKEGGTLDDSNNNNVDDHDEVNADIDMKDANDSRNVEDGDIDITALRESMVEPGGLYTVSLLLELLDELQFCYWKNHPGMIPSKVISASKPESEYVSPNAAIPQWYLPAIALLAQIGRTWDGMTILRTRLIDDYAEGWMGNALDVSIRHLHALALHWDDDSLRDGALLQSEPCSCGRGYHRTITRGKLENSIEAWIRLWHQVLLFVQQDESITFRSLLLDVQDFYTSAYAMLVASDEARDEIKSMIRLQLEELAMDEEDAEDLMDQ